MCDLNRLSYLYHIHYNQDIRTLLLPLSLLSFLSTICYMTEATLEQIKIKFFVCLSIKVFYVAVELCMSAGNAG